jgi:DnaK suppressor protein
MTKSELTKYRQILEARQAELDASLRRRDEIVVELPPPQAPDDSRNAADRELAIRNLDRDSILLRNVRAALRRIKDGTFGVCAHCEEDISPKRLAAVPWAQFCIRCQEAADRHEHNDGKIKIKTPVPVSLPSSQAAADKPVVRLGGLGYAEA